MNTDSRYITSLEQGILESRLVHLKMGMAVCLLLLSLVSCRSIKDTAGKDIIDSHEYEQLLPLATSQEGVTDFTARMSLTLDYNQHQVSLKGRLRMRRDEAIQLSLTAFGVMEVAFVEFTPQGVCVVDRMGKRYTRIHYASGIMQRLGIGFPAIQALFWDKLFIPGEEQVESRLADFKIEPHEGRKLVSPKQQRQLECLFHISSDYTRLEQTTLHLSGYENIWRYSSFDLTGGYSHPTVLDVSISGASHSLGAHITLSGTSLTDSSWKVGVDLSRYREVHINEILDCL